MSGRTVTISGAAGAWGDSSLSTPQLLADGRSDYIIYEGLAEITMAILSRAKAKSPDQGYARDLIETIAANIGEYRRIGARVVTNAGGVNPEAAADVIRSADPTVTVGVVTGDDLTGRTGILQEAGLSGRPISVNVYLGARPIVAALDAGAEVVVTGRVVDSALALGPLAHEFGWGPEDYDLLSAGSLAGHLIECGPQSTGGLLTDWRDTPGWVDPGFPIAEVSADGSMVITAPERSQALVDERTVSEQLLYEIGDPAAYLLPDVACDWREVTVRQEGANRVAVAGARGSAPPSTLKACAQVPDGWRVQFLLFIGGREAADKARRVGQDLVQRGSRMLQTAGFDDFISTDIEVLGSEDTYGGNARRSDSREVILKIAAHHESRDALAAFVREVPSVALGGSPGTSGGGSGLPRPSPLIRLECFPVSRESVTARLEVDGEAVSFDDVDPGSCQETVQVDRADEPEVEPRDGPTAEVPLIAIAHGRSGDKGADVNIGIRARHPDFLPVLVDQVTASRVADYLSHLGAEEVERYLLGGIGAVNFLLKGGLGAGGTASLRFDPQGKAVAQQLLDLPVALPLDLLDHDALREIPELSVARETLL